MFSRASIVHLTNSKSFERGRAMAQNPENIIDRKVDHLEDECAIKAHVASASGWSDYFTSSIITDSDYETIIDHDCNCPASARFDSMCKHCVALALTFLSEPAGFEGYMNNKAMKTSRALMGFVSDPKLLSSLSGTNADIHISVHLIHDFGSWSARFKISDDNASYVMASPKDFAAAMKERRFVSYGKKIAFVHEPDAFDEPSQKIAQIIADAIELRQSIDSLALSRSNHATGARELSLTEHEVVALLHALENEAFEYSDTASSLELFNVSVSNGDPELSIDIEEAKDGYILSSSKKCTVLSSGRSTYIFDKDKIYNCSSAISKAAPLLKAILDSYEDELFLSKEDAPSFALRALPLFDDALKVNFPESFLALKPSRASIEFYLDIARINSGDFIALEIHSIYGTRKYMLSKGQSGSLSQPSSISREIIADNAQGAPEDPERANSDGPSMRPYFDNVREGNALNAASAYFDETFLLPLKEQERVGDLLYGGLHELKSIGDVFTTPAFDKLLSSKNPTVQIGLSIDGDLLNMDVSPNDIEPDELAALLKSYKRKKRYHRLKSGAFLSLEDLGLKDFADMVEELGLAADDILTGRINLPAYRSFLIDSNYSDMSLDESFRAYIDSFGHIDQASIEVPPSLQAVLRPYQTEGFRWLGALTDLGFGGILADEMGLGKTIQVIALLLSQKEQGRLNGPALIICPASLVYNWQDEIKRFAAALSTAAIEGSKAERAQLLKDPASDILICSYDIARIEQPRLEKIGFSFIFLDEAQYIKNHATKTTRAIKKLNASHRFALTGTPIENRLSEIWSIFDFLMPGFLGSYAYFMQRYESDIIAGDKAAAKRLQALIGPFVLRRLKSAVLKDLPEKMESTIHVPLYGEQKKLYDANEQNLRETLNMQKRKNSSRGHRRSNALPQNSIEILAELTRLRQIALDPSLVYDNFRGRASKIDIICELVGQAMATGKKVLIFSQFTSYLDILKAALEDRSIDFYEIVGSTRKQDRIDLVNRFNSDKTPVFLVSLKAGGTGLNLVGAQVVIHADPWWNAAATNQATDRAHRIGQKNDVMVYKIIAKDTIEERIEILQQKKTNLADAIVKQVDASSLSSLTKEDLDYLLSS